MSDGKLLTRSIHFYRSLIYPNRYLIHKTAGSSVSDFVKQFRHLDEFKESGYAHAEIEHAFGLPEEISSDHYMSFIKEKIGAHINDPDEQTARFLGSWGWYEISDVSSPEQWHKQYEEYCALEEAERLKPKAGMQTSLF